jgi:hypothetical protein
MSSVLWFVCPKPPLLASTLSSPWKPRFLPGDSSLGARERRVRIKKREVRPLVAVPLINRTDDVARNRSDHDALER